MKRIYGRLVAIWRHWVTPWEVQQFRHDAERTRMHREMRANFRAR